MSKSAGVTAVELENMTVRMAQITSALRLVRFSVKDPDVGNALGLLEHDLRACTVNISLFHSRQETAEERGTRKA